MNIDTRIYAYLADGDIFCPACAGPDADKDEDLSPLSAYSGIFDRPCGEVCGGCHEYIVEPSDDHLDDGPCRHCGAEPDWREVLVTEVALPVSPFAEIEHRFFGFDIVTGEGVSFVVQNDPFHEADLLTALSQDALGTLEEPEALVARVHDYEVVAVTPESASLFDGPAR